MNQNPTQPEEKTSDDKNNTTFVSSNYCYEKFSSNFVTSMPSQYYNFNQAPKNQGNKNEGSQEKTNANQTNFNLKSKSEVVNTNISAQQQNQQPLNITNNITISNFSFKDQQKNVVSNKMAEDREFEEEVQRFLKNEEEKNQKLKQKNKMQSAAFQKQGNNQNFKSKIFFEFYTK